MKKSNKFLRNLKKSSEAKKIPKQVREVLEKKREKNSKRILKKQLINKGNTYVKRDKSILFKQADAMCNARLRRTDGYCKRQAGLGTTHPGTGRCKYHGGDAGRKPKTLDVYALALREDSQKNLSSLSEDKSIEAELAVGKLIVHGNLKEYENREVTANLLQQAVYGVIDTFFFDIRIKIYVDSLNKNIKNDEKKISIDSVLEKYRDDKLKLKEIISQIPISHVDVDVLSNHVVKTTKLLKLSVMGQGAELREALETVSKLAEKHHDMTEGKKLIISIDGVKDILKTQANIINGVCMNCEKRLEIARRLTSSLSRSQPEDAEFSMVEKEGRGSDGELV